MPLSESIANQIHHYRLENEKSIAPKSIQSAFESVQTASFCIILRQRITNIGNMN